LTKTPPDEQRIITRLAADDADSGRRDEASEILEMIGAALDDHADWLRKWHRAVICGLPPDREVVSRHGPEISRFGSWFDLNKDRELVRQPVFRQLWDDYSEMRDHGRRLALKAVDGERLLAREYDALMEKAEAFAVTARRIRDAFQRAMFDIDPLTGVHNRRSMLTELERERERSIRSGKALCICLCDIDRFKAVNDAHGHLVGDSVLLAVAGRLIANLRPYDSIYRFGGEEFLLAIAETDAVQAASIAERLRQEIAASDVVVDEGLALSVTASFGLAMIDAAVSLRTTIGQADEALYRAKRDGRNRVSLWWEMHHGDEAADG
jgi:diguanylate cyclase (GGDEF)-like protein